VTDIIASGFALNDTDLIHFVRCSMVSDSAQVTFFNATQLEAFLDGAELFSDLRNGILQRFMVPKAQQNEVTSERCAGL